MDLFKRVAPYQLFEPQQHLLDAMGPREIGEKNKDWQPAFWSRDISEPVKQNLQNFEFDEETPLETKLKRVIAYLKNETEAGNLDYCLSHTSEDYLERLAKKLSFIEPLWQNQPGFTKNKAFAAIKTLVALEIGYFFIKQLNITPDFPLKDAYLKQLKALMQEKLAIFEKNYPQNTLIDRFLKHQYFKKMRNELRKIYEKSTFKKDLHLIIQCANLWRQPIPKVIFFKNLTWISARMFRLCALPLPTLLLNLSLSIYPALMFPVCELLLTPLFTLINFLGHRFFKEKLPQVTALVAKIFSIPVGLVLFSAFGIGWSWFCSLSLAQGIGFLFGNPAVFITTPTGLTALMIGLTKLVGPFMWVGIPLGISCSVCTFVGIGLYSQVFLPLKRAYYHEALPPLENLKKEVLDANISYHQELSHNNFNHLIYLSHPVYLDDQYQVCFSNAEINEIKQQAVFSRFNTLSQNGNNFLTVVFQRLKEITSNDPRFANDSIPIDVADAPFPLHFQYQRNDSIEKFKTQVRYGISERVQIEELPVPRL